MIFFCQGANGLAGEPSPGVVRIPTMAGHNKWSKVKHIKGPADAKRNKMFTKLLREIEVATRLGGGSDPRSNPRLRDAMAEARVNNMPKDNIERAVKRGTGELVGDALEAITYEGYGPSGVPLLISCLTNNRNRTAADLRTTLNKRGGNLGESGCVAWMFEKKGILIVPRAGSPEQPVSPLGEDALLDLALTAGALDFVTEDEDYRIMTTPENFEAVRSALEGASVPTRFSKITLQSQNTLLLQEDAAQPLLGLIEALEELDDVQEVHAGFDIAS